MNRLAKALSLPPGLLAREASWRVVRTGIRLAGDARDSLRERRAPRAGSFEPFILVGRDRGAIAREVPRRSVDLCIEEAERALEGRFDILGLGCLDFGAPPDWSLDPVSDHSWPLERFGGSPPTPAGTDVKVPWEASRMHWLVALARANAYRPDERWVRGALDLVESWRRENPPGVGVNWANAMEVGIRAANLVWATEIFADAGLSSIAGLLLGAHVRFIVSNLEYSPRLTSNHYLGNLVGLLYAGGALRGSVEGRFWLRFGWRSLQREILKQFHPDGMNFEASTGYHRLSTELALCGTLAADALGLPMRADVRARLRRALEALAAVTMPDRRVALVGDDDGGVVVGLTSARDPRDPSPLLGLGAGILRLPSESEPELGPEDEFQLWSSGRTRVARMAKGPCALPHAGVFVLSDDRLWCLADCGGVGQNRNGGHAHNDTLAFVLCIDGTEVITDPGSFTYTRDPAARNTFRGVRSHATVEIDGEEINRFVDSALFTLTNEDRPIVDEVRLGANSQLLSARHRGYGRLSDPVTHRRTWRLEEAVLTIDDEIACSSRHSAVVSFPLAPGASVEGGEGRFLLVAGKGSAALIQAAGPRMRWSVERTSVSPRYGSVEGSLVLRGEIAFTGRTSWAFRISPTEGVGGV